MFRLLLLCHSSAIQNVLKVIKILLREHAFIRNRDSDLFLRGIFNVMHFVSVTVFGWRNIFRVITIFWGNTVKLVY